MNTTAVGRRAEQVAADFLRHKGCTVVVQNWRTSQCEIDVVAVRAGVAYFCEVKYRARNNWGSGLEYITPAKLRQMHFAARTWVHQNHWHGSYELCAIEVSGPHFQITAVVKDL